jgi:hypothetical protein
LSPSSGEFVRDTFSSSSSSSSSSSFAETAAATYETHPMPFYIKKVYPFKAKRRNPNMETQIFHHAKI